MLKRAELKRTNSGEAVCDFTCGITDLCPLETISMIFSKKVSVGYLISNPSTQAGNNGVGTQVQIGTVSLSVT